MRDSSFGPVVALVVAVLACSYSMGSVAAGYSKSELDRNMSVTLESCMKKQRSAPGNEYFSDEQSREFCLCYAKQFYSRITKEELDYANRHRTLDKVLPKIQESDHFCRGVFSEKWGNPATSKKSDYVAFYKSKLYASCSMGLSSNKDPLPAEMIKPICLCFGKDLSEKLTFRQMQDSDKNPAKYGALAEKTMGLCVNRVLSGR